MEQYSMGQYSMGQYSMGQYSMGKHNLGNMVLPLSLAVITLNMATSAEKFTQLTIRNQTYWLSSTSASVSSARAQCAGLYADLALFDTNSEYANVTGYIKKSYPSVPDLWIDLIASDIDNDGFYEHSWRSENISVGIVWYAGEPNENCLAVGQPCCARVDFIVSGLRDMVCGSLYFFLCKARSECRDGSHNCSQVCLEEDLGFACSCRAGYTLTGDKARCQDVDECVDPDGNSCGQVCINTVGSYSCRCYRGYNLLPGNSNSSCEDVNECDLETITCSHICTNTNGSYECACFTGYGLSTDKHNCTDVDECSQDLGLCSQLCDNTLGSYTCSCLEGFTLLGDDRTCEEVNECIKNSSACEQNCNNTNGSYFCSCSLGYMIESDGVSCVDVDECAVKSPGVCGGGQPCTNTEGSYFCGCPGGYQAAQNSTQCVDIDECVYGIHDCTQTCNNTSGGYRCGCTPGYHLLIDHRTCTDVNECADGSPRCSHVCTNLEGSFICSCHPGFRLDPNYSTSCNDIDECVENPRRCDQICENIQGSYHCSCEEGFALDADLVNCKQSRKQHRCPCSCTFSTNKTVDASDYVALMTEFRRNLLLRRTSLALYRNTKVTADDSRVSSQTIGFSGVIFMTLLLGVIIIPELVEILLKLAIRLKNKEREQ